MDIGAISTAIANQEIQAMYGVKCIKMAQESGKVVGSIIQDAAEISKEAMDKYLEEIQ